MMSERERLILERLAEVLPVMPETMKERLMGYGDCLAEVMRQQSPAQGQTTRPQA